MLGEQLGKGVEKGNKIILTLSNGSFPSNKKWLLLLLMFVVPIDIKLIILVIAIIVFGYSN